MTWEDYYEKINDWAVSTAISKISSLENVGSPDEIVDAMNIIAFEDEKGANKLLNKALQYGVKFSGDNLVEINELCSKENFKKALYRSADQFTAKDLEALEGWIDDNILIAVAKEQHIRLPEDMMEEYGEEFEDDEFKIHSAIRAADYTSQCMVQAQTVIKTIIKAMFFLMFLPIIIPVKIIGGIIKIAAYYSFFDNIFHK